MALKEVELDLEQGKYKEGTAARNLEYMSLQNEALQRQLVSYRAEMAASRYHQPSSLGNTDHYLGRWLTQSPCSGCSMFLGGGKPYDILSFLRIPIYRR